MYAINHVFIAVCVLKVFGSLHIVLQGICARGDACNILHLIRIHTLPLRNEHFIPTDGQLMPKLQHEYLTSRSTVDFVNPTTGPTRNVERECGTGHINPPVAQSTEIRSRHLPIFNKTVLLIQR